MALSLSAVVVNLPVAISLTFGLPLLRGWKEKLQFLCVFFFPLAVHIEETP